MNKVLNVAITIFSENNQPFTSIDIGNFIKNKNTWISNSEVADYLRKNALDYINNELNIINKYKMDLIIVKKGKAFLYYPENFDVKDYTKIDQEAISYKDFIKFQHQNKDISLKNFIKQYIRRARKEHICSICHNKIEKGEDYQISTYREGKTLKDIKRCLDCY